MSPRLLSCLFAIMLLTGCTDTSVTTSNSSSGTADQTGSSNGGQTEGMPKDIPIPAFPGAKLKTQKEAEIVHGVTSSVGVISLEMTTSESEDKVIDFYRKWFRENKWVIVNDLAHMLVADKDFVTIQLYVSKPLPGSSEPQQTTIHISRNRS